MSHLEPIAYTYEADYHCPDCAVARFGADDNGYAAGDVDRCERETPCTPCSRGTNGSTTTPAPKPLRAGPAAPFSTSTGPSRAGPPGGGG
jgi:hypothetical protein